MNKYTPVRPKCGSTDISVDFSQAAEWEYGAPKNYQCNECGNLGKFFPEVENPKEFAERLVKNPSKTEKISVDFGRGYARTILRIESPLHIFISLIFIIDGAYLAGFLSLSLSLFFFYIAYIRKKQ